MHPIFRLIEVYKVIRTHTCQPILTNSLLQPESRSRRETSCRNYMFCVKLCSRNAQILDYRWVLHFIIMSIEIDSLLAVKRSLCTVIAVWKMWDKNLESLSCEKIIQSMYMRLQQCELDQWSWYLPKLLSPLVQKSLFVLQCLSSAWKLHYGNPKRDFCTEECNFGRFVKQLKPHISLNFWIKSIFTHHDLCLDSYNYIRGGSVDSQYGQEEQMQQVKTVSKYICEYWAKIDFKQGEPVL